MKHFLFLLGMCICPFLYSQPQSIHIKGLFYFHQHSFRIDIERDTDSIKVVYSVIDSTTQLTIRQMKLEKNKTGHGPFSWWMDMDSLAIKNSFYQKDSLTISRKNNIPYDTFLDSCFSASDAEFAEEEKHKGTIVLDGNPFELVVVNNSSTRKFKAVSPVVSSYPGIFKLITRSFALYKQKKTGTFFSDNNTGSYLSHS